jgi:hypothetical protein
LAALLGENYNAAVAQAGLPIRDVLAEKRRVDQGRPTQLD